MSNSPLSHLNPFQIIYVGIDAHRYEHTAYAANRFEEKLGVSSFDNTKKDISGFLRWLRQLNFHQPSLSTILVGIEDSGDNGALITSCLVKNNITTLEVNPVLTKSRKYHQTVPEKSDELDAEYITQELIRKYLRLPVITAQQISPDIKALQAWVFHYDNLVQERTQLKNRLHRLFHQMLPEYRRQGRDRFTQRDIRWWKQRVKSESDVNRLMVTDYLERIIQIKNLLKQIRKTMADYLTQANSPLPSFPGVGVVNAARIHAEVKDVKRFSKPAAFRKYAATAPLKNQSAGRGKKKPNLYGNRKLNRVIHQVALTHLWHVEESQKYYRRKINEGKTKKQAMRSLKNRLVDIIYGVLKSNSPYRKNH